MLPQAMAPERARAIEDAAIVLHACPRLLISRSISSSGEERKCVVVVVPALRCSTVYLAAVAWWEQRWWPGTTAYCVTLLLQPGCSGRSSRGGAVGAWPVRCLFVLCAGGESPPATQRNNQTNGRRPPARWLKVALRCGGASLPLLSGWGWAGCLQIEPE